MSNGEVEEPEPPAEPEPVVGVEIGQILDDAPLALREAWESGGLALDGGTGPGLGGDAGPDEAVVPIVAPPALGEPFVVVLPPRLAATSAPGSRAPRRAADVAGSEHAGARHNWIPTGPGNVGGRVRALAVHPTNPKIMFAGAASGGVFRTRDGGESWRPLWHDQPSLAIGAIGICRDHPETVYVATGEINRIPGNGVYRSDDGGDTWTNPMTPLAPGAPPVPGALAAAGAPDRRAFTFDAIAVHPTERLRCWAVGPAGIFRTTNGGETWLQLEAGLYYSDVAFSVSPGAAPHPILYLVRAQSRAGEAAIVRLDAPDVAPDDAAAAQAALAAAVANADNTMTVIAAPPAPQPPPPGQLPPPPDRPARGKLAICRSRPDIAYVRFATEGGQRLEGEPAQGRHAGVFRTRSARANPPRTAKWRGDNAADPQGRLPEHLDWLDEHQGGYNLSIAVDPDDPNNLVTGMVELYLSRNANANNRANVQWVRAMALELYHFQRGHHEDNHAALFAPRPDAAPGTPPALWVANDGGVSQSTNWPTGVGYPGQLKQPLGGARLPIVPRRLALPMPRNAIAWRKRSHGIVAAQMYDLTQCPLVPTIFGCGFQDNGVYVTTGGPTWRLVMRADGGFVAFDPDDPYRFLATLPAGIFEIAFPGRLERTFPAPGDPILLGVSPRLLTQGFLPPDGPPFLADTVHHPREPGRVLHSRINRLYGLRRTGGDLFEPEQVGRGFDIIPGRRGGALEVLTSPGALRLGLLPQRNTHDSARPRTTTSIRSFLPEPYSLAAGDQLIVDVSGIPLTITFNAGGAIANLARATAAEVAAYIRAAAAASPAAGAAAPQPPPVTAQPCFWSTPATVEITADGVAATDITLGGSALAAPATELPRLGLRAGAYRGAAGRPASLSLGFPGYTPEEHARNRDLSGPAGGPPLELTIQIGGGPVRTVRFEPPAFPDPGWVRTGELAEAIRAALAADPAHVVAHSMSKAIQLTADVGGAVVHTAGTACRRLNLPVGDPPGHFNFLRLSLDIDRDRFLNQNVGNFNSFDLTAPLGGPPLQLVISDNAAAPAALVFDAALRVADLRSVTLEELQRVIQDSIEENNLQLTCDLVVFPERGQPSEIAYALSEPNTVWVGGQDGTLYRSVNDGPWQAVGDARFRLRDRPVEAIAIHPRDPRTVFVGLAGRTRPGPDPGFLFRTRDGGASWEHAGAGIVDTTGALVGINAIEIDAGGPDTVFAATDVGVFRSTNSGGSWQPFNEGLPNTLVRDLAFVPATRTLRAGAWGRGTFERHVGDRPPRDVRLYARMSDLDDGVGRPAPRGPDWYALTPRPAPADESPDIKVNRERPPGIGIDEQVSGVEFDEDIAHEEPTRGKSHVFVQVHNRGSFPAASLRLVALWADATNGPPRLPEDFWTRYSGKTLQEKMGEWHRIGEYPDDPADAEIRVEVGFPRVHTFADYEWPDDVETHRRIGILLLVSSSDDPLATTERDVQRLLATEPKAAYREAGTRRAADNSRLFLKQTGRVPFIVANPPGNELASRALGIPRDAIGGPGRGEIVCGLEPFNLSVDAPEELVFRTPLQTLAIPFVQGPNDVEVLAAAGFEEIVRVLNREFFLSEFPVRAEIEPVDIPPPGGATFEFRLLLRSTGDARFSIVAPPGGAVDAAPLLGFGPGGPLRRLIGGAGAPNPIPNPFNPRVFPFPAGGATLALTATNEKKVEFRGDTGDFANLALVSTRELRRFLDRELAAAQIPVRAPFPSVDLRVRRSITDVDRTPTSISGRQLADLVTEPAAVADPDARAALFDLVGVHALDRVRASADNFLYLRSTNLGDAPQPEARHRLFRLDLGAGTIATSAIAAPVVATVPAGGTAIVEFTWNPGAAAAGDRLFVLGVCDQAPERRLEVPASFATVEELDAFCDANLNAAYRAFVVGP